MSVINQMLRDLDQRQASQPSSHSVAPMMGQSKSKAPMLYITAIFAVAIIVAGYYMYSPSRESVSDSSGQQAVQMTPDIAADEQLVNNQQVISNQQNNSTVQQAEAVADKPQTVTTPAVTGTDADLVTEQVNVEAPVPLKALESVKVSAEDLPRVVKSNPNQSIRSRAVALYDNTLAEFGSPLSTAQYQQILSIDPSYHQVRIEWLTQLVQTDSAEFEGQVTNALQTWPEVFQYRQMLARNMVMAEPRKAYDLLLSQMPSIEKAPDYHGLIAYSAQQMGESDLARKKYELLLDSYPDRADWWLALALLQEQLGDSNKALAAYRQSLRFPGLNNTTRDYAQQRVRAIQGY